MGVKDLMSFVRPYMTELNGNDVSGSVGIDMSFLIHTHLSLHARSIVVYDDWDSFLLDIEGCLKCGSSTHPPICVFDGHRIAGKLVDRSRSLTREKKYELVRKFKDNKMSKEELDNFDLDAACRACVASHNLVAARYIMRLFRKIGIHYILAPTEAEQQLVHLQRIGFIKYILAYDIDYLVIGGNNLI